jgi:hypothetical protein
MKHLKKFENFYLNDENIERVEREESEDDNRDDFQGLVSDEDEECEPCEDDQEPKNWGDESLEEKKSSKEDDMSGLTAKQNLSTSFSIFLKKSRDSGQILLYMCRPGIGDS